MKITDIHIGLIIKNKVKEIGITDAELGRRINTTRQNVQNLFKRKSIDTSQLMQISNALEYDFFTHFTFDKKQILIDTGYKQKAKIVIEFDLTDEDLNKIDFKKRLQEHL